MPQLGFGKDHVVIEVRPPLTHSTWPWIGEQLGDDFEFLDGQVIHRDKDGDVYAKLVFYGNENTVFSLYRKIHSTMLYQGNLIQIKCTGFGSFKPTQFGPSSFEDGVDVDVEFDQY